MSEFQKNYLVHRVEHLGAHIVRLSLEAPDIAATVRPGQFVMATCGKTQDPLLRRPFSVHNRLAGGVIQLLFRVVGRGTALLAQTEEGSTLSLVGPLGRSFGRAPDGEVCLIGGGIGSAPLLFLAQWLVEQGTVPLVLLGAAHATELKALQQNFRKLGCSVHVSTDDGSLGHRGFVTELLPTLSSKVSKIYTCGPMPMMAAVARYCGDSIACEVSLETHMACGLGACLGCAIPIPDKTDSYQHVCKHGPVFQASAVQWP